MSEEGYDVVDAKGAKKDAKESILKTNTHNIGSVICEEICHLLERSKSLLKCPRIEK